MVARNSAPTENDGTTNDTGHHSGIPLPSPDQARRPLLDSSPTTEGFPSGSSDSLDQGENRPGRLARLREFVAGHSPTRISRRQRSNPSLTSNIDQASEGTASVGSTSSSRTLMPPFDGSFDDEAFPAEIIEHANRTEIANVHGPFTQRSGPLGDPFHLNRHDLNDRLARLAIANTTQYFQQRSRITATGSPSLNLRVSANDGGARARINSRADDGAQRARSIPALGGGAFNAGASPAIGSSHIPDNAITADGPLPAARDAPIVGTMPAVGRDAYITVQSPDNQVSFFLCHSSMRSSTN